LNPSPLASRWDDDDDDDDAKVRVVDVDVEHVDDRGRGASRKVMGAAATATREVDGARDAVASAVSARRASEARAGVDIEARARE